MNRLQLEYALALARYKNFTEAARHVYVTQPAFSKQIATLEKELGMKLFLRSSRTIELTPAGETMISAFKNIEHTYLMALKQAKKQDVVRNEHLAIGFLKELGDHPLISGALHKMLQIYPKAELRFESIVPAEVPFALEAGLLDVVVTIQRDIAQLKDIKRVTVYSDEVGVIVASSQPLGQADHFDLVAYQKSGLPVIISRDLADLEHFVHDVGEFFLVDQSALVYVPNLESMFSAVEAGLGVSQFSLTHRVIDNPAIRYFPLNRDRIEVVLCWKEKNKNPLIQTFLDLLKLEGKQR